MTTTLKRDAKQFYGIAENSSVLVNFPHDVKINKILVKEGQRVKKGDILAEGTIIKANELFVQDFDISDLETSARNYYQDIENEINSVEFERDLAVKSIEAEIMSLQKEVAYGEKVFDDLKEFNVTKSDYDPKKDEIKTKELRKAQIIDSYTTRIMGIRKRLSTENNPYAAQIQKLKAEKKFQEAKRNEIISTVAEIDGIVSSLLARKGENKAGYEPILTISAFHPSYIKGYIQEGFTTKPQLGEKFIIMPMIGMGSDTLTGKVTSAGSSVVEIPQRLSSDPDQISWGTEVIISIPETNNFQQNEKVIVEYIPAIVDANNNDTGHVTQLEPK